MKKDEQEAIDKTEKEVDKKGEMETKQKEKLGL